MITRRWLLSGATALGVAAASGAGAQAYPTKPIKMIVPFPPGGPVDTTARVIAQLLTTALGQSVIIENRPGAGATIGVKSVAIAEPDGYTLLYGTSGSLCVSPALYSNLDYDPIKSFTPIASVALLPHVFIVPPHVPAKTVAEFVAYAKANPGKLNYGASLGTPPHLLSTLFKTKAGLEITYIPYKGSAQSVTDLLGGQTHFTIDGMVTLFPLIRDGKVRALAVARAERWPDLPDVPTLVELGYPDFTADAWTGVVAPAGTPAPIVARLNAAINEGLKAPEVRGSLARLSSIPKIGTPQDFAAFLAAEVPKWAALVKIAGAKAEN
jgi:tripartite-type tricarboxylate transporter receptor subunit TctC